MARKIYSPTVGEMLINFIRLNDGRDFIDSPRDWIRHNSRLIKYINKLRAEEKHDSYQLMVAVAEFQKAANTQFHQEKDADMSALAMMKSRRTLELRIWAVTYYLHQVHSMKNVKVYKKTIAFDIHKKLIDAFPKLTPADEVNSAEYWQIPKVSTITTEWLKNI